MGAYVPLTVETIERLRSKLTEHPFVGTLAPALRVEARTLCDMAANSLLYAQEIHRLRDTQIGAVIEALRELVDTKDLHDRIENRGNGITAAEARKLGREYRQRRPAAWERARAVLASSGWERINSSSPAPSHGDAWQLYCEVFRDLFGKDRCVVELSPAALDEFAHRLKARP